MTGKTQFWGDAMESESFQAGLNFELSRTDIPRKLKWGLDEFMIEG
jgi:hypothetical protein